MSNFRVYPGIWIEMIEDIDDLKKGEQYQILHVSTSIFGPHVVAFVGMKGIIPIKLLSKYIKPISN
jgi:hypothetical protein